jgi:hypothetical protein
MSFSASLSTSFRGNFEIRPWISRGANARAARDAPAGESCANSSNRPESSILLGDYFNAAAVE